MMLGRRLFISLVLVAAAEPAVALAQVTVTISNPVTNAVYSEPAALTVDARVTDPGGLVDRVEFFQNAAGLGVDSQAPYQFVWTGVAAGSYTITVEAQDAVGSVLASDSIDISVNPGGAGAPPSVNDLLQFFDVDFQQSSQSIIAWWVDFNSASVDFLWAIGTTPGGEDVQPFTSVGVTNTATNLTLVPVDGTLYYVTVRGDDGQGAFETASSDGVTIVPLPGASPVSGPAPLLVSFTQQLPGVVLYEWEFELVGGGAKPDFISTVSGDTTHTYGTPGLYDARLTMVHAGGDTWSDFITITVAPGATPPTLGLSADVTAGPAPLTVTFTAAPTTFDGSVSAYLWDFNGDGVVDLSSDDTPVATHTFTAQSPFQTVVLTIVDGLGASATQAVTIDVQAPLAGDIPNISSFTATPATSSLGEIVTFDAIADAGGTGTITSYVWDFDDDGEVDRITTTGSVTWQFETSGSSSARLTVVDSENLSATSSTACQVNLDPTTPRCWITQPFDGSTIWGDFVSLSAVCVPEDQVTGVEFRYRQVGTIPWITIGTATPPPTELFGVHWDVTLIPLADYELSALATFSGGGTADSAAIQLITVTVDSVNPDEEEFKGSPFTKTLTTTVLPGVTMTKGITRDVTFKLIAGSTASLEQMRIERRSENPHPVEATLQGLRFLPGHFRNFAFKSGIKPMKPTRVSMYRDPGSSTILADGTDLTKSNFQLYCFNDARSRWEPLSGQSSNSNKLLLKATAVSTGDIGIAVVSTRSLGDAPSDCGLLGPELLLPLLLFWRRRRRSRS